MAAPACGHPPASPAVLHAESERAVDPAVLWEHAPTESDYARRTIYTWTTPQQVADLERGGKLLVREESPEHGASYFEQYVHILAERGDPVALLLDTTTFAKSRFGWTHPWATRLGFGDESYGDQLIRVTLRPEAYVLHIHDNFQPFEAVTMTGEPVAIDEVVAHPERIGAVYFGTVTYREYVLCNESMIESWAVGTADVSAEIARESAALDELARRVKAAPDDLEVVKQLYSALAFSANGFSTTEPRLHLLAKTMRASVAHAGVEGRGTTTFAGIGPRRPPSKQPLVRPRGSGSARGTY